MSALLTCQDVMHFWTSSIAYLIAMTCWVIDEDGVSSLVILEYAPKTNKVRTSLLEPTKLLMVLKDIWSDKLGLMPEILVLIIE